MSSITARLVALWKARRAARTRVRRPSSFFRLSSLFQLEDRVTPAALSNFVLGSIIPSGGANPDSVVVGDFNGDGKPDLAVANGDNNTIQIFIGNGDGTFTLKSALSSGGTNLQKLAVGDFNSDGKADLVAVNANSPYTVAVLMGNGDGTFQSAINYSTGDGFPNNVAVGDFNGDGKPDLVVTNFTYLSVLLNNGDGTFGTATTYATGGVNPYAVAVGDFNGDGKPDVVVVNSGSDNVGVLMGNGDGTFGAVVNYGSGGSDSFDVTATDLNGDGKDDIVVANRNSANVGILLNKGDGTFPATAVTYNTGGSSTFPLSVVAHDFDGDGKIDLAVANEGTNSIGFLSGNGDGTFGAAISSNTGGSNPFQVATGDFNGDGKQDLAVVNFASGTVGILLNGTNATTTTVTPPSATVFGQSATFTVSVAPVTLGAATPTGVVNLFDNGSFIGSGTLSGGSVTISTNSLIAGSHTNITASYTGGDVFAISTSSPASFTVSQASTKTNIKPTTTVTYGQPITLTATVAVQSPGVGSPTGTVTFYRGTGTSFPLGVASVDPSTGNATLTNVALDSGNWVIGAVYSGDVNFKTSTAGTVWQTVNSLVPAVILNGPSEAIVTGQSATFNVVVSAPAAGAPTPTGIVGIIDNGTVLTNITLVDGVASFTTSLKAGSSPHQIFARYYGDSAYGFQDSAILQQGVNKADTTVVLTTSGPVGIGQSPTFSITVSPVSPGAGTPTGSIQLYDGTFKFGTINLAGGQATWSLRSWPGTSGSPYSITAQYVGSGDYNGSTSPPVLQVVNGYATTVSLSGGATTVFGENASVTASVTSSQSGTPTGTVTFYDGATSLGSVAMIGGSAALNTTSLGIGIHMITATYSGDNTFAAGTSGSLSQAVNRAGTSISLTSSGSSVYGQPVILMGNVSVVSPGSGYPIGTVSFYDGAVPLGATGIDNYLTGSFSLPISHLSVGTHSITAVYNGENRFNTSASSAISQTVNKADVAVVLNGPVASVQYGQPAIFAVSIAPVSPGSGVPTGTVTFYEGASVLGTGTLSGGAANFVSTSLGVGFHVVTVSYNGDGNFASSLAVVPSASVSITPAPLTVTADSLTGVAGDVLPALTYTVQGLVNGDPATVVTGVTLSTTAATTSAPGDYPITVAGGSASNYSITQVDGTLTLVNAPVLAPNTAVGLSGGIVRILDSDGTVTGTMTPFPGFTGETRTATMSNGNLLVGTGPGVSNQIKVVDPATQTIVLSITPFEEEFSGGVYVSNGDILGTGTPQIIVSADQGGGPRVQIRDGQTGAVLMDFYGIDDPNFRGGARTTVGDITGDHIPDLIVAAGAGGGPRITIYDGAALRNGQLQVVANFFVFEQTLRNGAYVTVGDLNGDGYADLIAGGGPGGGPRVYALSGHDLTIGAPEPTVLANFFAGDPNSRVAVRIAAKNLDGDQYADLVTAQGPGGDTRVTAYAGKTISSSGTPPTLFQYDAGPDGLEGIFVG